MPSYIQRCLGRIHHSEAVVPISASSVVLGRGTYNFIMPASGSQMENPANLGSCISNSSEH